MMEEPFSLNINFEMTITAFQKVQWPMKTE